MHHGGGNVGGRQWQNRHISEFSLNRDGTCDQWWQAYTEEAFGIIPV